MKKYLLLSLVLAAATASAQTVRKGDANTSLALGDFPLQANASTYKEGRWSAADGLKFNSFSLEADTYTTYTKTADIIDIDPVALIQGDGSKFSICAPWKGSFFIISGDISNGTVSDMHCALANNEDGDSSFTYAIIKDKDNSTKTTWEPMSDDD